MFFDYTGGIKDLYCCPQPVRNPYFSLGDSGTIFQKINEKATQANTLGHSG